MKISQYEFLPKKEFIEELINHYQGYRYNTDIEILAQIAEERGISIEELIIPNSKFKESNNYCINQYNKFWYLIEKGLATSISLFEEKNLYMAFIDLGDNILINDDYFDRNNMYAFSNYFKYIKGFKNRDIEKRLYYVRTHILFKNFIKLFLDDGLNCDNLSFISEFDKTIFLTCMVEQGTNDYDSEIEFLIKHGVQRIRIDKELDFNYDLENNYEVLLEFLSKIDYKHFNELLIDDRRNR